MTQIKLAEMDDELENFIRERKARVADDRASLEQDPPYLEIRAKPRKAYGSTVKENIPPRFTTQEKDDTCVVGLPLGVDYEKKKKKLQYELRMDYRRYMAQRNMNSDDSGPLKLCDKRRSIKQTLERQADVFPKQQLLLLPGDAAALAEDGRLHRELHLPEEDARPSLVSSRYGDWKERLVSQDTEDGEHFKDELEQTEGRRHRHLAVEATYEKSQSTRSDGREKRETLGAHMIEGRKWRALSKRESAEFVTGLIIGGTDTHEASQRRKECYRQELQEQIAEQHRNKKKEKDLELKVAATGANDPEKQPDRIRQFGLSRRKGPLVLEPPATEMNVPSSKALLHSEKTAVKEQPHLSLQSPVLGYGSALSQGEGSQSPCIQTAAPSFPNTMDTARHPVFLPHPPPSLTEAYRSPYGESHHYNRTRDIPDPHTAYYAPLSLPDAGFPISYWNVPHGGAVPSQFSNHNLHTQHSGCRFPESTVHSLRPNNETAVVDSKVGGFPSDISRSTKDRTLSYKDALQQQIQEQQERKRVEREEMERFDAQLEADMKTHQPWGRGGGGAPLRDSNGNLFADLNQMHKLNEEAYSNPDQWLRRAKTARQAKQLVPECAKHDTSDRLPGFTHVRTPQFARGNVFANQPNEQQLREQEKYKAYLKQQIEEKMRKKAEEREQIRLEEEKEEKRLAEQRARIQMEYEEEQKKREQKEMEQKAKNEELIQLAEKTKKEAEMKRKESEEKENAALRRQYERERWMQVEIHREPSPPIPTLQKKHRQHQHTPRPPTVDSQHSTAPSSERSLSGLQSPPVPACRNQLRATGDCHDVFSELSALRRQLHSEQKRLESHLQHADWEELDSPMSIRPRERPAVDVFDMARLRLQAPVRRPNSRNVVPRHLLHIHDNLQLKCTDAELRRGYGEDAKLDERGTNSRRSQSYRDSYHQFNSQRSTAQDDYLDLYPPQQRDYVRSASRGSTSGFLLESESAFIDHLGDASLVSHTPELERVRKLSARERRRLAKLSEDQTASSWATAYCNDYFTHSGERQEAALGGEIRRRNVTLSHHGNIAGPLDVTSENNPSLQSPDQQSSEETLATDPWMRSGTSDTFKCSDQPLRRRALDHIGPQS